MRHEQLSDGVDEKPWKATHLRSMRAFIVSKNKPFQNVLVFPDLAGLTLYVIYAKFCRTS